MQKLPVIECNACFRRLLQSLNTLPQPSYHITARPQAQTRGFRSLPRHRQYNSASFSESDFGKQEDIHRRKLPSRSGEHTPRSQVEGQKRSTNIADLSSAPPHFRQSRRETRAEQPLDDSIEDQNESRGDGKQHAQWGNSPERQAQWGRVKRALRPRTEQTHTSDKERALRKELRYLTDPVQLSDYIRKLLDKNDNEKALALVRMSNRGAANTVSWNHNIRWMMSKGQTKGALECFNEMKKRGQKPDAHTFTILLGGLADHAHHPNSAARALSLYHSISASNSNVGVNIIHTNAVLKVLSRSGDLDSMWDIASKLPERGSYAANNWTFTLLLQTMRLKALDEIHGGHETATTHAQRIEETIVEGRKLWAVIVSRWRQGDLQMDEDLVCAMARVLLVGSRPRDWDDVMSLVKQTMKIDRPVPRLGTQDRMAGAYTKIRAPNTPESMKDDIREVGHNYADERPGREFDADFGLKSAGQGVSRMANPRTNSTISFARPGNHTLSVLLDSCLKTVQKEAAMTYWDLLTAPGGDYVVRPDNDNINMLLRMLRQARDSTKTIQVIVEDMPELGMQYERKTFRIAMSTCVRDAANRNVMDNAGRLLDLLASWQEHDVDPNVLIQYGELAIKSADLAVAKQKGKEESPGQQSADIRFLLRAIERLQMLVLTSNGNAIRRRWVAEGEQENNEDAINVMRAMIGLYDKVLNQLKETPRDASGLPQDVESKLVKRRGMLAKFVTGHHRKTSMDERMKMEDDRKARMDDRMKRMNEKEKQTPSTEPVRENGNRYRDRDTDVGESARVGDWEEAVVRKKPRSGIAKTFGSARLQTSTEAW